MLVKAVTTIFWHADTMFVKAPVTTVLVLNAADTTAKKTIKSLRAVTRLVWTEITAFAVLAANTSVKATITN